jgi:soluble lytic murein transglycosylase-like protein
LKSTRRAPSALILSAPLIAGLALLEPITQPAGHDFGSSLFSGGAPAEVLANLERAAAAVSAGQLAPAREVLEPLTRDGDPGLASEATVLLGLYAHATGAFPSAVELLASVPTYEGRLADWRLWALADSAEADGRLAAAEAAWAELDSEHRSSPLRSLALERAVALAARRGDLAQTLELAAQARDLELPTPIAARLEVAVWEAARALGDRTLQQQSARRLLVEHPLEASRLQVVDALRAPDGRIEWATVFTAAELGRRARRLLDSGVQQGAADALDAVPGLSRGTEWHLLRAETLIDSHRGLEALGELQALATEPDADEIRRQWLLARATLDASRVRRGRINLGTSQRTAMAARAREHLWVVAKSSADPELQRSALELLLSQLADDGDLADALDVLQALQRVDPDHGDGAAHLWKLGWRAFERRDYPSAIDCWAELASLFPYSSQARAGLYWTARAHDARGETARAQEIYRQVAGVEFDDFYRRHALRRFDGAVGDARTTTAPQLSWPENGRLARARLLSDLGLDGDALLEVAALGNAVDRRTRNAVEAIVWGRQGRRRESLQALWQTFPVLGTLHQRAAPEDALHMYYPLDFREVIERRAADQGLSPFLVLAMVRQESAFDTGARSHAGARGLMQIIPSTGQELARQMGLPYDGSRLTEPDFSVTLGTAYFRQVLRMFDGNEELALAGYNAGPYRIRRLWQRTGGKVEIDRFVEGLDYPETRTYVKRVLLLSDSYRRLYG